MVLLLRTGVLPKFPRPIVIVIPAKEFDQVGGSGVYIDRTVMIKRNNLREIFHVNRFTSFVSYKRDRIPQDHLDHTQSLLPYETPRNFESF